MHKAKKALLVGAVTVALAVSLTACGNKQAAMQPKQVPVLTMHVIQKDTPMVYEFVGEVEARDEVPIKANVSGTVIAKHVKGGEYVTKGQP